MLSSMIHNTAHAAQYNAMYHRIQTHGTQLLSSSDRYPQKLRSWTSQLFSVDHVDSCSSSPTVNNVWSHPEELTQEWNADDDSYIVRRNSAEVLTQKAQGKGGDDDVVSFHSQEEERKEIKKMMKEYVFKEMKQRIRIRAKFKRDVIKELLGECEKRQKQSHSSQERIIRDSQRNRAVSGATGEGSNSNKLLVASLEEYYEKFDLVVADLEDRQELIELAEFKQLVIQDLNDRSEARMEFQQKLPVVLRELMGQVVIHDLKHDGMLPNLPSSRSQQRRPLLCDEWIEVPKDDDETLVLLTDESDWICM